MKGLGRVASVLAAIAVAGCAGSPDTATYTLAAGGPPPHPPASNTPAVSPSDARGYVLTEEEKAADCGRLLGRMKIRILQLQSGRELPQTTQISRALQLADTQIGASATGADPNGDLARDKAMLEAYNAELASRGCKTLDLASELNTPPSAPRAAIAR